ncbi:MAG TPA: hypothetical protein VGK40_10040 [Verrucomicrobiae bacterium]|jgi:hypothetical protein
MHIAETVPPKVTSSAPAAALALALHADPKGPVITREPVTAADLVDIFSEAWREACLRKGQPQAPLTALKTRLIPILKHENSPRCSGFNIEVTTPAGHLTQCEFSIYSLEPVASRAGQRLKDTGVLAPGANYYYEVQVDDSPRHAALPASGNFTVREQPLTWLNVPLRPLLRAATAVDMEIDESCFPVFYTTEAFAKAELFSRKGSPANPHFESGGMLCGSLCSCADSGEMFAVVTDVLEAVEVEQTEYSLSYSSQSWTRIARIMKARQAAAPQRAERILGQAHGHNFLPNNGATCEACPKKEKCDLVNTQHSDADQQWVRAVFSRQPWAVCHIFGLAARGDKLNAAFTQRDNRLQRRGYFILPDFKPEQWEAKP